MSVVEGVELTRGFTSEEIFEMKESGRLKKLAAAGYVGQASIESGLIHFVPFEESPYFRSDPVNLQPGVATPLTNPMVIQHPGSLEQRRKELEEKHPMFRTTPQEKVGRMMLRLMAEVKRTGTIPGLSNEDIKAIVGESWRTGDPITADAVRAVAAHFLGLGEKHNREADSRRVTRKHPLA